jgi:hypothetical protein
MKVDCILSGELGKIALVFGVVLTVIEASSDAGLRSLFLSLVPVLNQGGMYAFLHACTPRNALIGPTAL